MPYFTDNNQTVKLCVMYILKTMNVRLTEPQLTTAVTEAVGFGFFDVQLAIQELEQSGMIASFASHRGMEYAVTPHGHTILVSMVRNIPTSVRKDCNDYVQKNRKKILEMGFFTAKSIKNPYGGFDINLVSAEPSRIVISVSMNVPDSQTADDMCAAWEKRSGEVYSAVYRILTKKD